MSEPENPEQKPRSDPTVRLTPEEIAELEGQPGRKGQGSDDSDDELVGTLLRGKWRVLERIGAGSFGTVYKVQDDRGGWTEALKILSVERLKGSQAENMRQRFLREARIMKRLGAESPHIVGLSTYEEDIEAGLIYFLMEHVEGRVLSKVLAEDGPFSVERAIRVSLQVCDALMVAHEGPEPVVHRDLKLENLMLTTDRNGDEVVKVLDFGIAKIAEREGDARLTTVGTLGTPGYAAPEQLRARDVDGRTDLFAFGVILYSLLTGRNPWLGHLAHEPTNQTYELMAASDRGEARAMEDFGVYVPPAMVEVVMRLLRREPDDRFQSARELRDRLLEIERAEGLSRPTSWEPFSAETSTGMRTTPRGNVLVDVSTKEMEERERDAPERRLAAVWFADLVGYSALSSTDEGAALSLLDTFHNTARRVIPQGGGRLVQFIGDAAFAEFTSTERAVRTATEFVAAFEEATRDEGSDPQLRVGVHVGDVLIGSDGDLFGDGVNVAARIQNEADPGQILVSQDVWRQLKQRRDFGFVSIGERDLKGIGSPVWLFAVAEPGVSEGPTPIGTDPSLTHPRKTRSRAVRISQVAFAYLAAASVVFFSSTVLVDRLGLASWVVPAALVLLWIGLVVVLATAWVQSRPTWDRSVGEQPPWALNVPDLIDAVSRKELPELTWARAIVGGVAAFATLFAGAGVYVLVTDVGPDTPPAAAFPGGPAPALAILPFAAGDDGIWSEGVPDLLGLALDDIEGMRVIDPQVVFARADPATGDPSSAMALAREVGAAFAVTGSAQRTDDGLALSVGLYDVGSEQHVAEAAATGSVDDVLDLVSELASRVLAAGVLPVPTSRAASLRLAEMTTASGPALQNFLEGEQSLRRSDFGSAVRALEDAVEGDPDFAAALLRLALARSRALPGRAPSPDPAAQRAEQLANELSERDRLIVTGLNQVNRGSLDARPVLERVTTVYPDDPDGWYLLGDLLFHVAGQASAGEAQAAFERAVDLAPSFGPAYGHLIDGAIGRGDTMAARVLVASYRDQEPEGTLLAGMEQAVEDARTAAPRTGEAPPPEPAPETEDPLASQRAQYRQLARAVDGERSQARASLHQALQARFDGAERRWSDAEAAAARDDFGTAVSTLRAARPLYQAIQRDNQTMQRVETAQDHVDHLRPAARDPDLIRQADQAGQRANQAVAQGRYEDAVTALDDAADLLEQAAPAPVAVSPGGADGGGEAAPPPPPTPAEVTARVLGDLKSAMDAEDIGRVRRVWTSITVEEAQGLENLFASVRELSVSYDVRSVQEQGLRVTVTVRTTYSFVSDQSGEQIATETGQVFELQQFGADWVIVGSRSEGF